MNTTLCPRETRFLEEEAVPFFENTLPMGKYIAELAETGRLPLQKSAFPWTFFFDYLCVGNTYNGVYESFQFGYRADWKVRLW